VYRKQELMWHASIQTTMNVYGQAMSSSKRKANSKVVTMVLGAKAETGPERRKRGQKKRPLKGVVFVFLVLGVFGGLPWSSDSL
jgi:hypothetical protein